MTSESINIQVCPSCQSELIYVLSTSYYSVRCSKSCQVSMGHAELSVFIAFADNIPSRLINDYSVNFILNDVFYSFTSFISSYGNNLLSLITYEQDYQDKELIRWPEFTPLQNNMEFYHDKVKRYLNLKAFW